MKITKDQFQQIFPNASQENIETYTLPLNIGFAEWGMETPRRIAAFCGQISVESGDLKYNKELRSKWNTSNPKDQAYPTGDLYEGRKALGNYVPNDGPRFIGRGLIQLTGRANYTKFGQMICVDLVKYPERAEEPKNSVLIALAYWKDRGCNAYADVWNIDKITELVNGKAKLHLEQRVKASERALAVLTGTGAA